MSTQRQSPPPNVPEIQRCSNCNNPILIGDTHCSRCGQRVISVEDQIRSMNPTFIAGVGIIFGIMLSIAAIEASAILQLLLLVAGAGLILLGSAYMGISIVFLDTNKRRK